MAIRCDDCRDLTLDSGVAWAVCRECVTSDGEPLAIFADRWRCAWAVVGEALSHDCEGWAFATTDAAMRQTEQALAKLAAAESKLAEARAIIAGLVAAECDVERGHFAIRARAFLAGGEGKR